MNALMRSPVTNRPAARVSRLRLSDGALDPAFDDNMFTRRSYLRAHGHDDVVTVTGAAARPALFAARPDHFLHLGRLDPLDNADLAALCGALFAATDAGFVVLEDIRHTEERLSVGFPSRAFRYQANWRCAIAPGKTYLTAKHARNLRWRRSKLLKAYGENAVRFRLACCTDRDADTVFAYNRHKIERAGGRYQTSAELSELKRYYAENAYLSALTVDDRLVAGNILVVAGRRVFSCLTGYDPAFAPFAPGFQVLLHALPEFERMGCTEINLLWGDNRWKRDFSARREPLKTVVVARNRLVYSSTGFWTVVAPFLARAVKAAVKPLVKRTQPE